jgi:hypothetical protein
MKDFGIPLRVDETAIHKKYCKSIDTYSLPNHKRWTMGWCGHFWSSFTPSAIDIAMNHKVTFVREANFRPISVFIGLTPIESRFFVPFS